MPPALLRLAGGLAPSLFAVAGKGAMSGCVEPIGHDLSPCGPAARMLGKIDWLDGSAAIRAPSKDSMEMSLTHLATDHAENFFPKLAPPMEPLEALLGGRASGNGLRWLMKAVKSLVEVAKAPLGASRFLLPCNESISKTFQRNARKIRGSLAQACRGIGSAAPQFKFARASRALRSMTANDAIKPFRGAWMQPED